MSRPAETIAKPSRVSRPCQNLFRNDTHKHYFCDPQYDKEREFICNCGFRGDAFDLPEDGRGQPILRLV